MIKVFKDRQFVEMQKEIKRQNIRKKVKIVELIVEYIKENAII